MFNLNINIFFWIFLLLIIFFLGIGLYARNYGRKKLPPSLQLPEGQQQAAKPSKDYLGWIKTTVAALIPLVIVVLIIGSVLYFGIFEVPDKVYSAEELLKYKISGNCQAQGDELVCAGPWKIFIPNDKNIGKLTVVPGSKPFKEMNIQIGPYLVEYSQVEVKRFGKTICGYRAEGIYHQALIYYQGQSFVYTCSPVMVPQGMAPKNLYVGTNWLRLLIPGSEDPQVYLEWDILTTSAISDDHQIYLGGDITLSGQQSARIKSLNIVFSRYKWIE